MDSLFETEEVQSADKWVHNSFENVVFIRRL